MSHLLLISLGPIQDFIDSARRCQDLWFGSWLLSDLARAVARAVSKDGENPLIFPSSLNPSDSKERDAAVANKILVRVPSDKVEAVAQAGKDALTERLKELMKGLFDGSRLLERHFNRELAEEQVRDMMEYIWVAVPEKDDYAKAREDAESLLARRKNTRAWDPFRWAEGVGIPKSSLDGVRESVLHEALYEDLKDADEVDALRLRQRYGLRGRERLCGVGLLKRLGVDPGAKIYTEEEESHRKKRGLRRPVFHSTGHIAAAPSLRLLSDEKVRGELNALLRAWDRGLKQDGEEPKNFVEAWPKLEIRVGSCPTASFTDLASRDPFGEPTVTGVHRTLDQTPNNSQEARGLDASILFAHEKRIGEVLDEAAPVGASATAKRKKHIESIQAATRDLFRAIGQTEAHAYYAFLLADGDRMGKALDYAGEEELQRRIGTALDEYSLRCEGIVAAHGGSLIYAGGDDVLALLPLHTALQCANALRLEFSGALAFLKDDEAIRDTLERNAQEKGKESFKMPTLSGGLALAHHMASMGAARQRAKEAEKLAKKERNSLAIIMHKRSGAVLKVTGSWDEAFLLPEEDLRQAEPQTEQSGLVQGLKYQQFPLHERLAAWVYLLARQELPDRVAFEIEDAVRVWEPELTRFAEDLPFLQDSVKSLLRRAVSRRRKDQGANNQEVEAKLRNLLSSLLGKDKDAREAARRLSAELQIARLLLSARDAAFGRIEGRGE